MDGKPLYEYARENRPLPRPIPSRPQTITELVLESFTPASVVPGDGGHNFSWPEKHLSAEERETFKKLNELARAAGVEKPGAEVDEEAMMNGEDGVKETVAEDTLNDVVDEAMDPEIKPATFKIRMTVSSGTYVRSIVHDIGLAIGSAAHVVTLTRTRQGRFALSEEDEDEAFDKAAAAKEEEQEEPTQNGPEDAATKGLDTSLRKGGCVPWSVWERAIEEHKLEQHSERMADQAIDDEWVPKEWERELYARFQPV
jgi:tRNA pseudouridine55 synthase